MPAWACALPHLLLQHHGTPPGHRACLAGVQTAFAGAAVRQQEAARQAMARGLFWGAGAAVGARGRLASVAGVLQMGGTSARGAGERLSGACGRAGRDGCMGA